LAPYDTTYKVGGWSGLICGHCDYRTYDSDQLAGVSTTSVMLELGEDEAVVLSRSLMNLSSFPLADSDSHTLIDIGVRSNQSLMRMHAARDEEAAGAGEQKIDIYP
jgi:hypothetical protein